VFPLDWCRRAGLEHGGPLNVFDLGEAGLLVRPVKAPSRAEVERLLSQTPAGKHTAKQASTSLNAPCAKSGNETSRGGHRGVYGWCFLAA
jgi:hypothetical protein